jgi:uncharacterized protein YbjQ (UPF0145 family)
MARGGDPGGPVDRSGSVDAEDSPSAAQEAERERSLARIEEGHISLGAERRLSELREHGGLFTSDLSVAGFALCHRLGLRPLSQVMGSSIYQVGYQASTWPMMLGGSMMTELDTLSDAWNEVRRRALNRLEEEATQAGANAVVGVQLRSDAHDWAENAIEYVVIGTAVRREAAPPGGRVVLTELSVSDYSNLLSAGIEPLGVVAWSAVFFATYSFNSMLQRGAIPTMQNFELTEFTQAFYGAREQVMARVGAQAETLGASGIVGMRIAHDMRRHTIGSGSGERGGLMVTFHAIGTAIRETADTTVWAPEQTIDLTT